MKMNVMTGTYTYNSKTYNFDFYTSLSAVKKLNFVDSVVSILVDKDHYNSVIRDIIFDFYLIDIFSTVDVERFIESDAFLNDVEEFLDETNIVDIIKANAENGLIDELNASVDKSIQYLTGIHPNHLNEALASLLSTIEKRINEVDLESMMDMAQKFAGMTEDFTMENVVNAYMNSDAHKKNLSDIAKAKEQRTEFANDMDKAIKLVTKNNK